jgi:L-seryl-tRNA(Ser) seleniumtransferase
VQEALAAGVDLVCCSGDKLLGGPQAGILVGRPALVAQVRQNPLARALRVDKMIAAALETVLLLHARGRAAEDLPVARMIAAPREGIEARARRLMDRLAARSSAAARLSIAAGESLLGGGSAPGEGIPTALLAVRPEGEAPQALLERLRRRPLPVIARVEEGAVVFDLRTVLEEQDAALEEALASVLRR